jgi:PAS domain S-box-containing protein
MDSNWLNYIPILVSFILTGVIGIYAWRHRQGFGAKTFALIAFAELSWTLGYIFELASPSLEAKIFWDDFQFIGSLFMPLLLMVFAYEYTGNERSLSRPLRISLLAFPILFLILLFTNPWHRLVRTSAWIVPNKPFDTLFYDFTTPMWASFIYGYVSYLVATILFIRNLLRQRQLFRMQTFIILVGFVFPFIGSLPGVFANITILGQRDITPYTFGIANLVFAWGLFRYGLFEITPIARDAVMEFMNDAAIIVDSHSRVVDVNPAALLGLELNANRVIGMSLSQLLADRPDLVHLFEKENPDRVDVDYISPSGRKFILDALISPLMDRHNNLIGRLVVARDITEKRAMEEELRRVNDELEHRVQLRTAELEKANQELENRNAELERFTYTVSHDLKSPLVTISGYLGYLKQDIESGNAERLKNDTQRIADAVDRMHTLLGDLLELSRIGRVINPSQAIQFADLVQGALEIVHGRLDARHITVQTQPNLPPVYGDKPRLIEVLQNLLDNAVKFMGDQPHPMIEIGTNKEIDGKPVFFVKDNGIGIAPEYHERIFGLFNRLDPSIEGTGVGLALVKRIIEFHGGRIWVESETGKGSTFYFMLANNNQAGRNDTIAS